MTKERTEEKAATVKPARMEHLPEQEAKKMTEQPPEEDRPEDKTRSLLRWVRVQTGLMLLLCLLMGGLLVFFVQQANALSRSIELVEYDLEQLQIEQINGAIDALTDAANQLASVDVEGLNDTAQALQDAAKSMSDLDMESLNQTIASLREAADTLKRLDMDAFNETVASLEKVSNNLEKFSSGLGGLFGGR